MGGPEPAAPVMDLVGYRALRGEDRERFDAWLRAENLIDKHVTVIWSIELIREDLFRCTVERRRAGGRVADTEREVVEISSLPPLPASAS